VANPNDIPLSASQRSRIRRLAQPKEAPPGEEAGELNVIPYLDIIMNIIVFVTSTLSVVFMATIDTVPPSLPSPGQGRATQEMKSKALNLTALITSEGVSLKTSDGNVATGCNTFGQGITVPKVDGKYDSKELTRCARELKKKNERAATETQVTITANPDVDYQSVIDAIDALRLDAEGDLFTDVAFGVAR